MTDQPVRLAPVPKAPPELDRTKTAAPEAAAHYMTAAVDAIDARFGAGFARDHPELIASLVQASAIEAAVNAGREAHGEAMQLASRISRETNETLLKLKPKLFG